jgi:hypothetical protein
VETFVFDAFGNRTGMTSFGLGVDEDMGYISVDGSNTLGRSWNNNTLFALYPDTTYSTYTGDGGLETNEVRHLFGVGDGYRDRVELPAERISGRQAGGEPLYARHAVGDAERWPADDAGVPEQRDLSLRCVLPAGVAAAGVRRLSVRDAGSAERMREWDHDDRVGRECGAPSPRPTSCRTF